MIDTAAEHIFPFSEMKDHVASRPSLASVYRWAFKGVRGVKLETVLIGGRRFTSREAVARFVANINEPRDKTAPVPSKLRAEQIDRAAATGREDLNGKTRRVVATLRAGTPVPVAEVLKLYDQMVRSPFRTVASILFGADRISPCPACGVADSSLSALDRHGICYGRCGKVKIDRLYDALIAPRAVAAKEGGHAVA